MDSARCHKGFVTVFAGIIFLCACHEVRQPLSKIDIAEVRKTDQLLAGFYPPENGAWSWTAQEFTAALKPPEGAERRGATLELQLYIPDSQIESIGPMTLSAATEGYVLDPEKYSKGGTYIYSRTIPKDALATSLLLVKFYFDKARMPYVGDGRELAAIVSRIELQTD
jgi:hypothetical protein